MLQMLEITGMLINGKTEPLNLALLVHPCLMGVHIELLDSSMEARHHVHQLLMIPMVNLVHHGI